MLKIPESQPIEAGMVSKSIESAQVKVEGFFFDQRKRLVEFDDVMNQHRTIIYGRRRQLLDKATAGQDSSSPSDSLAPASSITANSSDPSAAAPDNLRSEIINYIAARVEADTTRLWNDQDRPASSELIINELVKIIPFDQASQFELAKKLAQLDSAATAITEQLQIVTSTYDAKTTQVGAAVMSAMERIVVLSTIDEQWMDHLDQMDDLREGIWLRGDKNTVLAEYQKEAFEMFEALMNRIEDGIVTKIFRINLVRPPSATPIPAQARAYKDSTNESLLKEVADARPPTPNSEQSLNQGKAGKSDLQAFAAALGASAATTEAIAATSSGPKSPSAPKKLKIGRNDPCYCGSGKKYKKCHMLIDEQSSAS
jgi:preprotein translocase subunit SecA